MSIVETSANPSPALGPIAAPRYGSWQEAVKDAVRDPRELCRLVGLGEDVALAAMAAARDFPVFAPRGYVARMRPGDAADPLLRQVLPRAAEGATVEGFGPDPVGDRAAQQSPGLLQKYRSRVLMVATGACAVHCRYCFRRHFPYAPGPRALDEWAPALAQIGADPSLREVILSGGDPLMLADGPLAELVARLAQIGHLRRLRVHTRLPVMIPQRVTAELVDLLARSRLTPIVVIHANHARELSADVAGALAALWRGGAVLLNQSVLLAGVNDDADTLVELSERLVELRVLPYYLHQLDRVAGAAHFEVGAARGRRLIGALRARLPGYAVPRYVRETAGAANKLILA